MTCVLNAVSVRVRPGVMALTVTPVPPVSEASARTIPTRAAFDAV